MNLANAFGFLVLGSVMNLVPSFAPSSVASDLWLHFMGCVVGGIGSTYVLREGALKLPTLVGAIGARLAVPAFAKLRPATRQAQEQLADSMRVGA